MRNAISRRVLLQVAALGAGTVAAPAIIRPGFSQQAGPIRLGVVTPLSGPQEFIGIFVKQGAEIAIEQINATGGVAGRPLALEFRDDKANPALATTVTRELLGLGVNLQLGTISSAVALAMGPLMEKENGVVLTCGAGTEKLNHENYSPNVFRVGDSPYMRGRAQAKLVAERKPELTKWSGIVPDHEFGRTTWGIFVDGLLEFYPSIAKKQAEIIDPVIVPYGQGDYKNFITQALRSPAEAFQNSTYGGDAVTLFQQARPFGLFQKKYLINSSNEFIVANALGAQVPAHWTGIHWYFATNKGNPLSDKFYADYVAKYGNKWPMGWAAEAHSAVLAYVAAITKAKSTDTPAIVATLKGLTWDTVTGKRTLRAEDNQALKDEELIYIEPDPSSDVGFKVSDYVKVDGNTVIEPATPGRPLQLRHPT